jgi:hypothetical protein
MDSVDELAHAHDLCLQVSETPLLQLCNPIPADILNCSLLRSLLRRLALGEEFSWCEDNSTEAQDIEKCLRALDTSGFDPRAAGPWYDNSSALQLSSVGKFVGPEAIEEYFLLFGVAPPAMFLDACTVEESFKIIVEEANADGCKVSVGNYVTSRMDPDLMRDSNKNSSWFRYVFGASVALDLTADIKATRSNYFFPEPLVSMLREGCASEEALIGRVCETYENSCSDQFAADFSSTEECLERLGSLPSYTNNNRNAPVLDSNSTGCRVVHSTLVNFRPDLHCPHLSYFPAEDTNGNVKCSAGYEKNNADLFSPAALDMFSRIGAENGLPADTLTEVCLEKPEELECSTDFVQSGLNTEDIGNSLSHAYCFDYLESQKATSEHRAQYWLALLCMLAMISLRIKVNSWTITKAWVKKKNA